MVTTNTPTNINEIPNIKTPGITISQIFSDHWGDYFKKHRAELRGVEIREVWKMLHCQDPSNGYLTFECPDCGETKTIHFNCNSRICTHCGKIYDDKWASDLAERLFDVPHRHVIMTMSHYLWPIFKNNWRLLKVVMDSAIEAIADAISKRARRDLKPAFVVVLHTYGGDLKFNVHLHLLVAEGGFRGDKWVDVNVIPYTTLRHKWQEVLLTNLKKHRPDTEENRELMRFFREDFKKDFFVNAKRRITGGKKEIAKYIGRYIRHPAVANSRITNYDGKTVTFYYDKKDKDGKIIGRLYKTMEVEEFIEAIISHIPDNQFRTVRYYGGYWRIKKSEFKGIIDLETIYQKSLMDFIKISEEWAPNCPKCECKMALIDYKPKKPPPDYLFERKITDWCEDLSSVDSVDMHPLDHKMPEGNVNNAAGVSIDTKKFDAAMSLRRNVQIVENIMRELERKSDNGLVPIDDLIKEVREHGIDEKKLDGIIIGMRNKGTIYEPHCGQYGVVDSTPMVPGHVRA